MILNKFSIWPKTGFSKYYFFNFYASQVSTEEFTLQLLNFEPIELFPHTNTTDRLVVFRTDGNTRIFGDYQSFVIPTIGVEDD